MPPRLNLLGATRSLAIRPRPSIVSRQTRVFQAVSRRGFADEKDPKPAAGPNQDVLPHVSEEAGDMSKITGETGPDVGQGTPVQEILERDEEGKSKAPEVIKEQINDKKAAEDTTFDNLLALGQMQNAADGLQLDDPAVLEGLGHKFGLPQLPLPSNNNLKHRYDPVVSQVTNLLMKHGKKGVAQRNMSYILNHLRTAPPPVPNPARPLVPGSPLPSRLPLDPIQYLTVAIDSISPLVRIKSLKGVAGGGAALPIPVPLTVKQRRRQAVQWILDATSKKQSRGSGKSQFAQRFAEELISVVEGRSGAWDRRGMIHKSATSARANLNNRAVKRF
ncbi:37S ribosomal [Hyphodiscus hymeniophilus]|uniref:Small ribosomal subunit protein uS7m n=1 Tax=Hyphodiscus hymeniophilus TaxID=353542 RepID=A0A9P7AXB5_9HELO|nr:37S ribosomal [Hyphodiscus hymeniophilus]